MYIISVKSSKNNSYAFSGYRTTTNTNIHFTNTIVKPVLSGPGDATLFETINDAKKWVDQNKEILISKYSSDYDLKHIHILEIKNSIDIDIFEADPFIVKYLDYEFAGSINYYVSIYVDSNRKITLRTSYGEVIEKDIDMKDLEKVIDDLENGKYA